MVFVDVRLRTIIFLIKVQPMSSDDHLELMHYSFHVVLGGCLYEGIICVTEIFYLFLVYEYTPVLILYGFTHYVFAIYTEIHRRNNTIFDLLVESSR